MSRPDRRDTPNRFLLAPAKKALNLQILRQRRVPRQLVEGLADQEFASLADAILVVGVRTGDDDPDCDSSVGSPLGRWSGFGPDILAQSLPGLPAAKADLGDKLVVPLCNQARVLVGRGRARGVEYESVEG